jgi:hypothetical protein
MEVVVKTSDTSGKFPYYCEKHRCYCKTSVCQHCLSEKYNTQEELWINGLGFDLTNKTDVGNMILSKSAWDDMKNKIQIANTPPSSFGSVKIITSIFVPENMILLRQGNKVVGVIKIDE